MIDVVIIGAGIIGSFIAHDLSKYNLNVVVLESENDVANQTTMANSAIIHTGYDPLDNTLKAELNVEGASLYKDICQRLDVPYKMIGAIVVARNDEEISVLTELMIRASKRKIPYIKLTKEDIKKMEPNISDEVKCGLSFPTTAIIDPMQTTVALMEVAIRNNVDLHLNEPVIAIDDLNGYYKVRTSKSTYESKYVINCAGLSSDKIANMIGDYSFDITYRRGEYFVLDQKAHDFVKHIIYPVPSKYGKGVLCVPTVHGNIMLGPTAEDVEDMSSVNTTINGLNDIKGKLNTLVSNIPMNQVIRSFAGLRAKGPSGDFIIYENQNHPHFINVAGIDSPGIASAPAISKYVITNFFSNLSIKDEYVINRIGYPHFKDLPIEEKQRLIEENPKYGKIICRCEKITEQEIIDCINRPCGATTVKGVKKRVRPGMGRCQGGFCEPLVVDILARTLNKDPLTINYDSYDTEVLLTQSKGQKYE